MKKLYKLLILALVPAFLATACGRKGPDAPHDKTPPAVIAVTPGTGNNNSVPPNAAVLSATFSEPVDENTITFKLVDGVVTIPCTRSYSGTTAICKPSITLAYGTQYVAVVSAGVQDLAGNLMTHDVSWGFTTAALQDTTPEPFTFPVQINVALNTVVAATSITVSGIKTAAQISITDGEYSINGGAYTSAAGTVTNGQTVTVRQTSSGNFSTMTNAVLTIGGVSGTFSVITLAADTTPYPFSFTALADVALSTVVTSDSITVSGTNTATQISITGGEYSINGGAYTLAAGTVKNGDTVTVQQTSSGNFGTTTNAVLTIGMVNGTFSVTTLAPDTTPTDFAFAALFDVALNTGVISDSITVSGLNTAAPISIAGGKYSVNGGAYTAVTGFVNNGDTVTVQQTSSEFPGTTTDAVLTIGEVTGTFSVTTIVQ